MAMLKKAGIIFTTLGAVLMLSALLLLLYNEYEEGRAGREAGRLLDDIQSTIEERADTSVQTTESEIEITESYLPSETLPSELPTRSINGFEYIGYISIPDLKLKLPVMSEWDYERLKVAPCRHFGSSRTDDLVIAAHNYKTHFGSLSGLEIGAEICFTDMNGIENHYTLEKLETLAPDAVDAVCNSGCDLVLYTCTAGGAARVAAFCNRVETNY